jgi:hypothetical protein
VTTGTSLLGIDPARGRVVRRIRLTAPKAGGVGPTGIAYVSGSLWISVV